MDFAGLIDPARDSLAATRTLPIQSTQSQLTSVASLGEDFELFLEILTTQLRNQDPLNPVESEQFVDQLTQFSQLEQQVRTNDELQNLQGELRVGTARDDANLIGRNVQALSDTIGFDGTNQTAFQVIADRAADAVVRIFDESGQLVREVQGALDGGGNFVVWDGTNQDGVALPAGSYRVAASAVDAEGSAVRTQVVVTAPIQEVRFGLGGSQFLLGTGATIEAEEIIRVSG